MTVNGRRHARVEIPLLVQYQFGALDPPQTDYSVNVSSSGLYIACTDKRPVGSRVLVHVTTRDGLLLHGEGRVARLDDGGTAIELVGFRDDDRAVLDRVVQEALARAERGR